ncbi:TetR/AcrR family transcriptional regulator [Plantactinospora sonchi]|uniref:TetR/AcrR family transcriptional regulator n=1 Tax=Plantactinospora sonchi TaxID=1544735 RepID=A0ABU7RW18_9ACTN
MSRVSPRGSRRQESAAQTRELILNAAAELFATGGYAATTVNDVAAAARVAVATVYTSVGGKPTLVRALIARAVDDPATRQTVRAVRRATGPAEVIQLTAAGTRHGHEAHRQVLRLMGTTMAVDPTIADAVREAVRSYREALRVSAVRLAELSALRDDLTVDRAADILWFHFGLHSWEPLTEDCGWSYEEAQRWLTAQADAALLRR